MRRTPNRRPSNDQPSNRRPLIWSTALATAVAAELAVGTLLVAPPARADETPAPSEDPAATAGDPPIRTGRTDDAPPAPADPVETPEAPSSPVRSGRFGDSPAPGAPSAGDAVPGDAPDASDASDAPDGSTAAAPDREDGSPSDRAVDERPSPRESDRAPSGRGETGGRDQGSGTPTPAAAGPSTPAPGTTPTQPAPTAPVAHTVVPGDNLWEIAAAHVATVSGRPRSELGAVDIAPYWTKVCMTNRPHLISGDVNLVYAGEEIELPAV